MKLKGPDAVAQTFSENLYLFQISFTHALFRAVMQVTDVMKVNAHDLTGDPVRCECVNARYACSRWTR